MFIYTIRNKENDNVIYIGSTRQSLNKRFLCHKADFKKGTRMSLYDFIRDNDEDFNNYYIELYEQIEGISLEQLRKREGEIIRGFKAQGTYFVINHNIAGRTSLEYMNEKYKNNDVYRQEHKTKMRELMNDKYKNNLEYRQNHLEDVKQRYRERKENEANTTSIIQDLTDRYFI